MTRLFNSWASLRVWEGTASALFGQEVLALLMMFAEEVPSGERQDRGYGIFSELRLHHEVSVDNDKAVQEWLKASQHMDILGNELAETCDLPLWNLLSGQFDMIPASPVCVCSWVCHTVPPAQVCGMA